MINRPDQRHAVILVSGSVNYYYDAIGYRLAQVLRNLGLTANVSTLKDAVDQDCDWLFVINLHEVLVGFGGEAAGLARLRQLRKRANAVYVVLLECVQTQWFQHNLDLCNALGIDALLDLGFHTQVADLPPAVQRLYRPVFNGLTAQEQQQVRAMANRQHARPIPWTFIGHQEIRRVRMVETLISQLAPDGLVYLPNIAPVSAGSAHITGSQLQTILEKTRWYIWNAHHPHFYVESERFRNALLAGAVPIKVSDGSTSPTDDLPFIYLMPNEAALIDRLRSADFEQFRQRFADDYLKCSSLESEFAKIVGESVATR